MKKIEVLRSKGYSLSLDEEAFRSKLSSLQRELNQPNLFKGRLNELSALVRMQEERQSSTMYDTVDDESLEKMHKVDFSFEVYEWLVLIGPNCCISSYSEYIKERFARYQHYC